MAEIPKISVDEVRKGGATITAGMADRENWKGWESFPNPWCDDGNFDLVDNEWTNLGGKFRTQMPGLGPGQPPDVTNATTWADLGQPDGRGFVFYADFTVEIPQNASVGKYYIWYNSSDVASECDDEESPFFFPSNQYALVFKITPPCPKSVHLTVTATEVPNP